MATYSRPTNHTYMGESREDLPAGGYVLKIYDAKERKYPSGDLVYEISFDVAEGPQKDFYKNDYARQTGDNKWWRGTFNLNPPKDSDEAWKVNKFWDFFYAVEDSNPGFQFSGDTNDINKAKFGNKLFGATFRREESKPNAQGRKFWNTRLFNCKPVSAIRDNKFSIPKDKPYTDKGGTSPSAPSTDPDGFMSIPDGIQEELPF